MLAIVALALLALMATAAAVWSGMRAANAQREVTQQQLLLEKSAVLLGERNRVLSTLVDADGALSIAHMASDTSDAGATVYWNRRDGRSLVSAWGLATLPRERVYALWVRDSSGQRIVTTFNTGTNARYLSGQFMIAPGSEPTAPLIITVELASGAEVPDLPAVLAGAFQRLQ